MAKLLMITGDRALAEGKRGAFYNTIEEFHKHWDRIDIICPQVNRGGEPQFGNVFIHSSPWPIICQPWFIFKKGLEIYKEQKFDLMTVHEFPPFYNGLGAKLLERFTKVPYILEIFHIPGYPMSAGFKERLYKNLTRWFIRFDASSAKAVRVMNPVRSLARVPLEVRRSQASVDMPLASRTSNGSASPQDLDEATSYGMNYLSVPEFLIKAGVPKDKIIHIPAIYVDLDIFKPMSLQKKYDLIFVGRLAENKGIELFLEVVKKMDCSAIVVGDGPLRKNVWSWVISYKLQVELYGFAKDSNEIARLLNESKVLVMPSYNEGGPRVAVEALACGVPILATPVGIIPDLLKNNLGGEVIDWNADDIAQKAGAFLNDAEKYEKYSSDGIEMAKHFERKTTIENYVISLKKLITKK